MNASDRFTKKNLNLNYNTLEALSDYFENGGTITVCKTGKRSKSNTSFPMIKGTVSNIGAKSVGLKNSGLKGRKG
jgi:hypothetical protein